MKKSEATSVSGRELPPFIFRQGTSAHTLAEFLSVCEKYPEDAIYHFQSGHFEPWLNDQGETQLADKSKHLRMAAGDNVARFGLFVKVLRETVARSSLPRHAPSALYGFLKQQLVPLLETLQNVDLVEVDTDGIRGEKVGHSLARLREETLSVGVIGAFKRGKSTLINALLGESFLPTDITPVTAAPTCLTYGPKRTATVVFNKGEPQVISVSQLADFVDQSAIGKHAEEIARVEITHPALLLQAGLRLIDTPGVGAVFQHHTQAALDFLPQCQAVILPFLATYPIGEDELHLLSQAAEHVHEFFFVQTWVDMVSPRERESSLRFSQDVIATVLDCSPEGLRFYSFSPLRALEESNGADPTPLGLVALRRFRSDLREFVVRHRDQIPVELALEAAQPAAQALLEKAESKIEEESRNLAEAEERVRRELAVIDERWQAVNRFAEGYNNRQDTTGQQLNEAEEKVTEEVWNGIEGFINSNGIPVLNNSLSSHVKSALNRFNNRLSERFAQVFEKFRQRLVADLETLRVPPPPLEEQSFSVQLKVETPVSITQQAEGFWSEVFFPFARHNAMKQECQGFIAKHRESVGEVLAPLVGGEFQRVDDLVANSVEDWFRRTDAEANRIASQHEAFAQKSEAKIVQWQGQWEILHELTTRLHTIDQVVSGLADLAAGRIRRAIGVFRPLHQQYPQEVLYAFYLARAYAEDGRWSGAEAALRRARGVPDRVCPSYNTLNNLAVCLMHRGDWQGAVAMLDELVDTLVRAVSQDETDTVRSQVVASGIANRSLAYLHLGKWEAALENARHRLCRAWFGSRPILTVAYAAARLGAKETMEKAVALFPQEAEGSLDNQLLFFETVADLENHCHLDSIDLVTQPAFAQELEPLLGAASRTVMVRLCYMKAKAGDEVFDKFRAAMDEQPAVEMAFMERLAWRVYQADPQSEKDLRSIFKASKHKEVQTMVDRIKSAQSTMPPFRILPDVGEYAQPQLQIDVLIE
jgi:tetratricopeptide (TPR) repeat protein